MAASHRNGVTVKANMVAGFIAAVQSAVLAIENELGTAVARNDIRKDGAVAITGTNNELHLQESSRFRVRA
ncbi:MAG: hypothetical protein ABSH05_01440 [Bryobacteraceae bacterium]|jgi:hypothetical protein